MHDVEGVGLVLEAGGQTKVGAGVIAVPVQGHVSALSRPGGGIVHSVGLPQGQGHLRKVRVDGAKVNVDQLVAVKAAGHLVKKRKKRKTIS
jgi:hypothetical protein